MRGDYCISSIICGSFNFTALRDISVRFDFMLVSQLSSEGINAKITNFDNSFELCSARKLTCANLKTAFGIQMTKCGIQKIAVRVF